MIRLFDIDIKDYEACSSDREETDEKLKIFSRKV